MHAYIGKTKDTYIYTIYIYYICDIYMGGREGGGREGGRSGVRGRITL